MLRGASETLYFKISPMKRLSSIVRLLFLVCTSKGAPIHSVNIIIWTCSELSDNHVTQVITFVQGLPFLDRNRLYAAELPSGKRHNEPQRKNCIFGHVCNAII